MTTDVIRITVEGPCASGKSGIVQLVEEVLRGHGINVVLSNPEHPPRNQSNLVSVVSMIKDRDTSVEIFESHTGRVE